MKQILFDKQFLKNFAKRIANNKSLENKYKERINLFLADRQNPILKDHALKGNKQLYRSFSITGDCRVIYIEKEKNIIFLFIDIGSHNQVYD